MDEHNADIQVPTGPVNPADWFPKAKQTWLEIGFGAGEHLTGQAQTNPDMGIIGIEVFVNGAIKALEQKVKHNLHNLRVFNGDARDLISVLPDTCLDRVFILFPDPWPKARHHKRRLVNANFLDELARVLKPGAKVRFATDWADYANQAMVIFDQHPKYNWTANQADDWRIQPADHIATRYQTKNMGDCAPVFFDFTYQPKDSTGT